MLRALKHYENHPSIKGIQRNVERRNFSFSFATFTDIEQQLKNLNLKKTCQDTDMPTKILKENFNFLAQFVLKNCKEVITTSTSLNILKHANVRHVYKKDSRNKVRNYRPLSISSNLSEVCEKCLLNEMATHFDNILSKYQWGLKKGFSSQQCLIVLLKKWGKIRDKGGLSKAFHCLLHAKYCKITCLLL